MAVGAGEITHVRRVGIGLVGGSLGGHLRVATVAIGTDCHVGLFGRRGFAVAGRACESGGYMFIDQKSMSGAQFRGGVWRRLR